MDYVLRLLSEAERCIEVQLQWYEAMKKMAERNLPTAGLIGWMQLSQR